MAIKYPNLFKPYKIGNMTIKNRVAMAPMHLGGRMDSTGNMTDEVMDYYEARAKGGFGIIFSNIFGLEGGGERTTAVLEAFDDPVTFNSTVLKLSEKIHAYGSKFIVEAGPIFGRNAFPDTLYPEMNGRPVAPSEVPNRWDPSIMCRAITTEECYDLINKQVGAAVAIQAAGADGICLGGAYGGYFPDQFAMKIFNHRDDEFGYAQGGQYKIHTDTIKGIKEKCGKDFPVVIRLCLRHYMKGLGQAPLPDEEYKEFGRDLEESLEIARIFEEAGADAILIGGGSYDSFNWLYPPTYQKEGLWLEDAKKVKEVVNIPVICPGKVNTPEMAEKAIREGYVDAVALGRASIADPDWVNKAKRGADEDIRPCIGCNYGCIGRCLTGGMVTCAVNPTNFYEKSDPAMPARIKKHVVVIGGGVGGMEAAMVAAQRGHNVDLYEKNDKLGGLFNLAAVPDFKTGDHRLLAWFERTLKKSGVNIHLNTELKVEDVAGLEPDEVIYAAGGTPKSFKIEGAETVTASDVLAGREVGKSCVLIGGGLVGCEVAVWLARKGVKVTLVEALPALMAAKAPVPIPNMLMMLDMLPGNGVDVYTSAKFSGYADGKATIIDSEGKEIVVDADTIVQAVGFAPNTDFYDQLNAELDVPVWNIGDSKEQGNVLEAVRAGWTVAKCI